MSFTTKTQDNKIICSSPTVVSSDASYFSDQIDRNITKTIIEFVSKKIAEIGMQERIHLSRVEISDMFQNSLDSFTSYPMYKELKIGSHLELSAVVKRVGQNLVIKFKDNAKGIVQEGGREKYYKAEEIKTTKNIDSRSGLAIRYLRKNVKKDGGIVRLKNRKAGGCAVYMIFGLDQKEVAPSEKWYTKQDLHS
jgi:hypothetical protein